MKIPDELYDVVIIDGGTDGLSAAIYAARAKLSTLIVDKNPAVGALGMASRIENYPGALWEMTGIELLSIFRKQAQNFGAKIVQEQVYGITIFPAATLRRITSGSILSNSATSFISSIILLCCASDIIDIL